MSSGSELDRKAKRLGPWKRKSVVRVVIVWAVIAILLYLYSRIPWEWSDMDDSGFVLSLRREMTDHGYLGIATHVLWMINVDLTWGLFRPAYWLYPSFVYVLPIELAHVVRLVLLGLAFAGPIVAFKRRGSSSVTLVMGLTLMVIPALHLIWGLFFVSLQELSGAAFIGLGLMARSQLGRTGSWIIAAWFKSPFAWILIGQAAVLWYQGKRRDALISGAFGIGTLLLAYAFSRTGSYTSGYTIDYGAVIRVWSNIPRLLELTVALTLVALVWWLVSTRTTLQLSPLAVTLGVGWLGYTLQLLPWGVTGNYAGAINYLLAVFLFSLLTSPEALTLTRKVIALSLPILISMISVYWSFNDIYERNSTARGITDCIIESETSVVYLSPRWGIEAERRFRENVQISDPMWLGQVSLLESNTVPDFAPGQLVVVAREDLDILDASLQIICELPRATIALRSNQ